MISVEEAILKLRRSRRYAALVRDAYLGENVLESATRFATSAEFEEVQKLLWEQIPGGAVLDLGAGNGIASWALAKAGARIVYALEPDASDEVGRGAIRRLVEGLPVDVIGAVGEEIPLADETLDIVYARQVLHHARDLAQLLKECSRVLKRGGRLLACREHVADDEAQLQAFLARHPVHRLAGGENAFPLSSYVIAIRSSGLEIERVFGPWDTVVNAFPAVKTNGELDHYPRTLLKNRLGKVGYIAGMLPGTDSLVRGWLSRPRPGRMYSFLAMKV